jgi:tetratricopeptide (TPR) repeat protein
MKKVLLVCLAIFLFLANCQKKEEPKVQTPFPAGPVNTQNEIRFLQEALRQDPNNLNASINLGNILMDTSRFDEAINAYQHALELDPKNVDVRVDIGTCYRNIGKPDRAVEEFRKAIKINPRHLYAHRNLGVVLAFDIGDKKSAIKAFEEYLRLSPDTPDAQRIRQEIAKLNASK